MLESVRLKNFKSFSDTQVNLKPLTVILGPNGAGKSSFIQSLLLMRQTFESGSERAILNGPLVNLGTGRDILRQGADDEIVEIEVTSSATGTCLSRLAYEADSDTLPATIIRRVPSELSTEPFVYLTAERVGPRLVGPRSLQSAAKGEMGARGEGALAVLEHFRAGILPADDPRRGGATGSLEEIFQLYLGAICPTARVELQPYGEVDSIGSSYIFTPPGGLPSLPIRPTNVGFGLSYSLPIIVAALTAKPGGILIIENPEAHLHTISQRAMTELLYRTASAGVQVILETHSRETFHWLRNKSLEGAIDGTKVSISYFQAAYDAGGRLSKCDSLQSASDSLQYWPQNFFEEYGSPSDLVAPVAPN